MPHYREEVLNIYLAELLQDRGIVSVPETITHQGKTRRRKMPDIVVDYTGLRVVLEGKVDDVPQAREQAFQAAQARIEQGIVQIGIAVVYPAHVRHASDVKSALAQCEFALAVITESKAFGYVTGGIDYLKDTLDAAFYHLIQEDVVAEAVAVLDAAIDRFAYSIVTKMGVIHRLAKTLGLSQPANLKETHQYIVSVAHISGLVITNALVFQEILALSDNRVLALQRIEGQRDVIGALAAHWRMIIEEINYYPIFHVAREQIIDLTATQDMKAFQTLIDAAKTIVCNKAALRHDLMGRVYHRLLADSKYLGTYYTTIPAATLLLRLALRAEEWPIAWHALDALPHFKIADLACGTGTLLMAAAEALTNNYINAAIAADVPLELNRLHRALVEAVIHGYDVLASAIHLTASTLAMRMPESTFQKMNLISLPLGGKGHSLGSLEFLRPPQAAMPGFTDVFGAIKPGERVTGRGAETVEIPRPPDLDLCVMNPPFTRSVGGNLLFGSSPKAERKKMQCELRRLLNAHDISASATAGLGAVFVAIGDRYLRCGGRIALVLPKALISGIAWGKTRDLLKQHYQVEYIIASQDPAQWNFSESTSLSEVLLIARKTALEEELPCPPETTQPPNAQVIALNLWRNPQTAIEAAAIVRQLSAQTPPDVEHGQGAVALKIGAQKVGVALAFSWGTLRDRESWMLTCAFAQPDVTRVAYQLLQYQRLWIPGQAQHTSLPLTALQNLGALGPDRRDIYDGFELTDVKTAYPTFWGHKATDVRTLAQTPNAYLTPLAEAKPGRPLRKATQLWPLAGKVLLGERLWLYTQHVVAVYLPRETLANVWWSFAFHDASTNAVAEKILTLWLNSTIGLLILLASRDETRGAWVDFKKPSLAAMPVLNIPALTPDQRETLAATYDRLCEETLLPFPHMHTDATRAAIDAAFEQTLALPDLTVLRELLAQEPVICLQQL